MATEKTDVVIVGVGAAGGILAAELGKAGMKVIYGTVGRRDENEQLRPLTAEEFDHVKKHVIIGYRILADLRPIRNLAGTEDFNEVVFDRVFIPSDMLIGEAGGGWKQVTSELAYERSGPERFLSTFRLLLELIRRAGADPDDRAPDSRIAETIGRLAAHLWTLRRMSLSVAGMLQAGATPNLEAAIVKDLGNALEREIPELVRLVAPGRAGAGAPDDANDRLEEFLREAVLNAPSFTLRGGTREILRGIIARGLGLR